MKGRAFEIFIETNWAVNDIFFRPILFGKNEVSPSAVRSRYLKERGLLI